MPDQLKKYLDRPQTVYALLVAYTLSAILQGLSFAALIAFLRSFLAGDYVSAAAPMWWLVALGLASFVIMAVAMSAANRVSVYDVCGNVIARVGRAVSNLPLGWFDATSAGRVAAAISSQVNTLSHLCSMLYPQLISAVVTPLTVTVVALVYDWRLGLILAAAFPVAAVLWRWSSRVLLRVQLEEPAATAGCAARVLEYARIQPVLRAQEVQGTLWAPLEKALADENAVVRDLLRAQSKPALSFALLAQSLFAAVIAAGLVLALHNQTEIAVFLGIAVMANRFTMPITTAVIYASEIQKVGVAFDTIGEIIDSPGLPEPLAVKNPENNQIELVGVDFGYIADQPVFNDLTIIAKQNQITALVGPSGCGKSTIVRLVARFWDVDSGQVRIGGVDVREIGFEALMKRVSMVFQDVYLFDTTIAENVRIARPNATDAEVDQAIERARLTTLINALPEGINTQVGEGGLKLSGGERQRVSIARAFLKDAPILLLDEITSALDAENEAALTATLAELSQGRTVLVIAHRLTTIMGADHVYVLSGRERGVPTTVVEQGSPAELAAGQGVFASLVADAQATARWQVS